MTPQLVFEYILATGMAIIILVLIAGLLFKFLKEL